MTTDVDALFDDDLLEDDQEAGGAGVSVDDDAAPDPHFGDVVEFVERFVVHVYARQLRSSQEFRWCASWHAHPEAVSRLSALWRAFETLRSKPGTEQATWWIEYADPTINALTQPGGTFRQCSADTHVAPPPLPSAPLPPRPTGSAVHSTALKGEIDDE